MESLLKNLKEQVTCSICLDTYTKPKTIACFHTFCCQCLEKHALFSQMQGKFRCSECQTEVDIPEGNRFDNLPTSFLHNSLLSLLAVRQSGDGILISCGICKKKSAEISCCFDCEKLMCPDCVNAHELFQAAAFEGHKVTPVKQFQAQDYEALLKRQSFCSQQYHEREVTKFFCLDCETCVCQICINTNHRNHNIESLEKAADVEKANIMAGVKLLKQKRKVYTDLMREVENTTSKVEANITTAIGEVSQAANQMIAKIRELERKAITELRNTGLSRTEKLDCVNKQTQSSIKQIDQAAEFANNLIERSASSDIMQSKKNLEQRFEDLYKTAVPALPVGSFVKFVSTIAPEGLSLGFMATSEIDVHLSTVQGITEIFQAGLDAELLVCPRFSKEELTNGAQQKLHVEVLVEPVEQEGSLTIREKEDGNFQTKFIPKVPGMYNITVKINGDTLANSPFTVQVKERQLEIVGELDLQGEMPQDPTGIAVNSNGLIAVSDREKNCVLIFDKEGKFVRKVGYLGKKAAGRLNRPKEIAYLNDDEILVADELNHCIQQFNVQTGDFVKSFGKKGKGEGEFQNPTSVCVTGEGHIVVVDSKNGRIQFFTNDGKPLLKFGDCGPGKLSEPHGCIYHKNMFVVSDSFNHCLKSFDSSGKFLYKIGEKGKANGQFSCPWGLCVEKYGNRQNLLVCDLNNNRIQQCTMDGCFNGKTVTKIRKPRAISVITTDGRILVCDSTEEKVYVLK